MQHSNAKCRNGSKNVVLGALADVRSSPVGDRNSDLPGRSLRAMSDAVAVFVALDGQLSFGSALGTFADQVHCSNNNDLFDHLCSGADDHVAQI